MKMAIRYSTLACIFYFGFAPVGRAVDTTAKPVDFAREVLPILSNKCFVCHGPDGEEKEVLRLDSFEAATRESEGHRAVDPAAPEKS
ncbi:MAG: c-type cytochrome domain-containing protein, partial [Pirellulales bacterium]